MKQLSFAQAEFAAKKKVTRRKRFLGEMEQVIPWAVLLAALAPHYFPGAARRRGRPPIGLERMLRMYCLQQGCALADEALAENPCTAQFCDGLRRIMYQMAPDLSPPSRSAGRSIAGLCDC